MIGRVMKEKGRLLFDWTQDGDGDGVLEIMVAVSVPVPVSKHHSTISSLNV